MSLLAKHYGWDHDFWRRMGRNQFYAWVDQLNNELKERETTSSWKNADQDPGWQAMRDKRKRYQGR